jgi:cysteine desulfurase
LDCFLEQNRIGESATKSNMRQVYLDHQATTPVAREVFEAMRPYFAEVFGSASSLHQHGLRARDALAKAREQIAALINAESAEDIIFTSDGTESANLAIKGAAYASRRKGSHFVISDIEHPSVTNSVEFLEKQGFTRTRLRVDQEGWVDPEAVRAAITDKTILIAVHHVNHDIGTIEPIIELGKIASDHGIPFYVDAEASAGWLPIDVQAMGASLLSFSPHRFYGPKGIGVLYRNRRTRLTSLLHGGVQEGGRRAGTENVPAIVGAGVAAETASRELPKRMARMGALQKRLWEGLKERISYLKLNGPAPGPKRISTNLNISFEFVEGESVALMADAHGIAVASGAACMSKALKVSPVLLAIAVERALAQGNIIFSLGKDNTETDIDYALEVFPKIVAKLRGMSPTWDEFQRGIINSATKPSRFTDSPARPPQT